MKFRSRVRLDPSQVSDRRGMGGGTIALGGGGLVGIVVLLLVMFLGGGEVPTFDLGTNTGGGDQENPNSDLAQECVEGEDANQREDCRIVGVINSVQSFWTDTLEAYRPAKTVFFDGSVSTGCGNATSAVGPFYCPPDEQVYIDLGFYDALRRDFGARGGPFAEAYVIGHEYGHHVQNIIGVLERSQDGDTGPQSGSVRAELMADCLAGMWAKGAVETGFIVELTTDDIRDGMDAAAAIGDDRIQESIEGRVDPESWTHGSAQQRQDWLMTGYTEGSMTTCDTFQVDRV